MKDVKKIDIHTHVTAYPEWVPTYPNGYRWLSGEEMIGLYNQLNIEKGGLLPIVSPEGQWIPGGVENHIVIARKYPDRFYWFCNLDPAAGDHSATTDFSHVLEHYKLLGAKGVGELTSNHYVDDPMMDNLFYHCAQCDMPVTIHISPKLGFSYGIVDDLGLPKIDKMLKKYKSLKIIGHSQAFWSEISSDVQSGDWEMRCCYNSGKVEEGNLARLMRENENLYCDLSAGSGANAMMRDSEYAAKFIEEFADRIMYGTDVCSMGNTAFAFKFDQWLDKMVEDGMISFENYKKIVRENAIRILKLEE